MNKRERTIIVDRFVQVKNLTEWYKYKLSGDSFDTAEREYAELRHTELDREALVVGSLGRELGLWDAMWDAWWDQRVERNY